MKKRENIIKNESIVSVEGKNKEAIAIFQSKIKEVPANDLKSRQEKQSYHSHQSDVSTDVNDNEVSEAIEQKKESFNTSSDPFNIFDKYSRIARKRKAYTLQQNKNKYIIQEEKNKHNKEKLETQTDLRETNKETNKETSKEVSNEVSNEVKGLTKQIQDTRHARINIQPIEKRGIDHQS